MENVKLNLWLTSFNALHWKCKIINLSEYCTPINLWMSSPPPRLVPLQWCFQPQVLSCRPTRTTLKIYKLHAETTRLSHPEYKFNSSCAWTLASPDSKELKIQWSIWSGPARRKVQLGRSASFIWQGQMFPFGEGKVRRVPRAPKLWDSPRQGLVKNYTAEEMSKEFWVVPTGWLMQFLELWNVFFQF